ncbi:MAG: sporulation rane protein YtaF [Clostridiaceae bacterium]|jgi:putative sporulation protein YtaF|nr:sporulation rane protein YtaF [Clostridiaceae bacterium]
MMALFLSALIFSLASNLDNAVVGTAYGIRKIKIGLTANVIIAIVTSLGTFISMHIGLYISRFLSKSAANHLGAAVIIMLGIYFLTQSIIKLFNNTKSRELALKDIDEMIKFAGESDLDSSGDIGINEAFFVALALTLNNLGTGVVASITGVNIDFTVIFTFIISIFTIKFGEAVGNHILGKFLGKYAPLFSGLLLIMLGIIEFIN